MVKGTGIEFQEESEFKQENISLNDIILRHIRKISDLCCGEFTGGYWDKKPMQTKSGILFTEIYHEDKREAFCNAVNFLIDVISPKGDNALREFIKEKDDDSAEIKKKMIAKRKIFQEINNMFDRTNFFQGSESVTE